MAAKKKKPKSKTKKATRKKATRKKATRKKATRKNSPVKAAKSKRAAPKKSASAGKPKAKSKPVAKKKKPRVRRDATGHLDPSYARDLRRRSKENLEHDDDRAFLVGKRSEDALAQELGKEFVETVTSGEDEGTELRDAFVSEEIGGPFITSTRGQEFAEEPDESNPVDATREPFPKT